MSFRLRLLLTSLATLVVGLGAMLAAGNVLLERRVDSETTSLLRGRSEAQLAALSVTPAGVRVRETPNDALLDRQSWILDGDRVVERPAGVSQALDRTATALARRRRAAERRGPDQTRLLAVPVLAAGSADPVGAIVVALSVRPLERLEREVLIGSFVTAALILLAGGLAIRGALDGALRPVRRMTASAEDWGAHDLDRRFDLGPPRDELTGLAATLDHLLARIAASRRHEQRFASEMAHELRTPLAGLRARAELALGARGPDAGAEREAALRSVLHRADDLGRTIDGLLALARQELDPTSGAVDVAAVAAGFPDVEVVAPAGLPRAEGEPDVVHRALAPLVDNARRHARSRVTIELSAGAGHVRAAVRDDGPGVEPQLRERVFGAGVRGDGGGGAGLGLALARRLARSCGGDVVAGDGPGGCFVLVLPAVAGGPSDGQAVR
ncbi:MAG: two-component system, OmpR family, sensor kinase [Solirubrobacteraceae bacterium]|nr:two-component system, OmpR family, sensor kinase [Solirubrobacteraceae bacterium]